MPFKISLASIREAKAIAAIVLAVVCAVLGVVLFSAKYCLTIACGFLILGFLRIETKSTLVGAVLLGLWGLGCLGILCVFSPLTGQADYESKRILLNFLCVLLTCGAILLITGRWQLSVWITFGMLAILLIANSLIYQFRGKELALLDFLSIGTALNVAEQYAVKLTSTLGHTVLIYGLFLFSRVSLCVPKQMAFSGLRLRLAALVMSIALFFGLTWGAQGEGLMTWSWYGSRYNGFFLNFYLGAKQAFIQEPDGYTSEFADQLAEQYGAPGDDAQTGPNIIVIMNESFADLRIFGELSTNLPVTPYMDSLKENTVRGYALCSVYGGNTANSEFEFLTGHSMAFLPAGAVAYQQYINQQTYSLAWLLDSWGYTCTATHPYMSNGWSRTRVYPWFGFGSSIFEESYLKQDLIREYISDREMYGYILDQLDQKQTDEKLFLFGITMQNHGAYYDVGQVYDPRIELVGYEGEYPETEEYLSLIHQSDRAVEYLLTALEDYPEDTVVLFFGDHMPMIEPEFYEELYGKGFDSLDDQMLRYTVPFFIWSNFEMESQTVELTGLNYLSRYLLECAGFELPAYYRILADMEAAIPAVSANGYYSSAQGKFLPVHEAEGEELRMLQLYSVLQYNNLIDTANRSQSLFGDYIATGG